MKLKLTMSILALFSVIGCNFKTRIIRETDTTAVIQGVGLSKIEAMINAEDKAKDMFGNYKQTAPAECNEGMSGSATSKSAHMSTYIICTLQVEKQ